jgi:WD40 repeat protein/DNA-binding MarR family transcriptional regulator
MSRAILKAGKAMTGDRLSRLIVVCMFVIGTFMIPIVPAQDLQEERAFLTACGSVDWSPDGTEIATVSKADVAIMNPLDGTILKRFSGHTDTIRSVKWSPDGTKLASCAQDGTVRIWDVSGGSELMNLSYTDRNILSVSWAPDGKRVASGLGDGSIILWDIINGTTIATYHETDHAVASVAWSPDGNMLAAGGVPGFARLYDVPNASLIRGLSGHKQCVNSIAWSPDGSKLVTGSDDDTAKIWDASTGTMLFNLSTNGSEVCSVAWSPDGQRIATGDRMTQIRLWDAASGALLQILSGHGDWVTSVDFSPDGTKLASASSEADRTVRIWGITSGILKRTLAGHSSWVHAVSWSPDGSRLATASADFTVKIWAPDNGTLINTFTHHNGVVRFMQWSPDGTRIASWGTNDTISIWDPETLSVLKTVSGTSALAWSPDGKILATGSSDNRVCLWDAINGTWLRPIGGHAGFILSMAWSPDGKMLATGSMDGSLRIWDTELGIELGNFTSDTVGDSIAWSPDGRLIAATQMSNILLLDSTNFSIVQRLLGNSERVESVAWSPDGSFLASCDDYNKVILRNGTTFEPTLQLDGHSNWVWSLAWSRDGTLLASGSRDNTVKIWGPFEAASSPGQDKLVASITASPSTIASGAQADIIVRVSNSTGVLVPGADVEISAASGVISGLRDNGNGSYSAKFTAPVVTANETVAFRANISKIGMMSTSTTTTVMVLVDASLPANRAPEIVSVSAPNNTNVSSSSMIKFSIDAVDPDGDNLTFEWQENGITLSKERSFSRSFSPGKHTLILLIGDGQHQTTRTFNFTVTTPPKPPASENVVAPGIAMGVAAVLIVAVVAIGLFFAAGTEVGKYRLTVFFLPLYIRQGKDDVLDNETRGMIRGCIYTDPGIHYNEIMRRLKLSNGTAAHHLMTLEREGFVKSRSDGRLKRFYPAEMKHIDVPPTLTKPEKMILETVQESEGISQGEISKLLEIPYATINRHVNKLAAAGMLRLERHGMTIKCFTANGKPPEDTGSGQLP